MFRRSRIERLIELKNEKKRIDEELKNLERSMIKSFKRKGEKVFENEQVKITFVESFKRTYVDSDKIKKDFPEVYKKCTYEKECDEKLRITLR